MPFPHAQSGSFTAPSGAVNLHFGQVSISARDQLASVTGSAGGTTDTAPVYETGIATFDASTSGVLQLDSDGTHAKGELSTVSIASDFTVKVADMRLRKSWPLVDVTGSSGGSADTSKIYDWGLPDVVFSGRGWVEPGWDGDLSTKTLSTFTLNVDDFGTVAAAGNAILQARTIRADFDGGGPIPVSFQGRYSGGVTYTGSNFSWLFPTPPGDPPEGTLTLDIDATSNESNNALLYDFELSWSNRDGNRVPFSARFRYSQSTT